MAESHHRYPANAQGPYYVDDSCIDCDQCRHHAPEFFVRDDSGGQSYVARQPFSPGEVAICDEALDGCPTNSIGNDGAFA